MQSKSSVHTTDAGLTIDRRFTVTQDPDYGLAWTRRTARIANPDGSVVFEQHDVEVPENWSQTATDILASKYFRKTGVPQPDGSLGGETSLRQVVDRLAGTWAAWGARYGYFASPEDTQAFADEVAYMLVHQMAAPNSPQWFNTGLSHAYGITGSPQGHWYVDPEEDHAPQQSTDAYTRPTPHACFIQRLTDDLVGEGGIFDLLTREARVFKFGSGSGANYSVLRGRGEPLSGGGKSSGLMSFLKIFDTAAGSIKSGGTTRRSARMVCVDVDHPEIEDFINWKAGEERKVAALVAAGYDGGFEGEAYNTVSGQNANNSVRVTDEFMQAVEYDQEWDLINRTDGQVYKTVRARDLWQLIAQTAWQSADPGIQFDTTINDWHTCPVSGRINASNPCSEYMFLDDTACNLASINLVPFLTREVDMDRVGYTFDTETFRHAVALWTVVLEISVLMAQFPSKEIAENSYDFRTLGLGYANLGSLLMRMGLPYDSRSGRALAAGVTALMTGEAYATSAKLAQVLGPFPRFEENREAMLRVIRNHRTAAEGQELRPFDGLERAPVEFDYVACPQSLAQAVWDAWGQADDLGQQHGYRNAQVTLLAPTGTISFVMDCDTTGIEPDYSLIKLKKLSGGGHFKIVNQSVEDALYQLGYKVPQVTAILEYVAENETIEGAPYLQDTHLPIFDCANRAGSGVRSIAPMGHVLMMASVQPFLSGAISKTVNLPTDATVEAITDIHAESWRLGLKSVAIYRDSSKLAQPLNAKHEQAEDTKDTMAATGHQLGQAVTSPTLGPVSVEQPTRRKMPVKRFGFTQEGEIAGHKLFVRTGEYEDGSLGEIFVDLHKEGAAFRSLMSCFSIAVSKGLQYGVPLSEFVDSFTHQKFEPQGMVQGHPHIKMASSIIDYVFRVLALEYLGRTDLAQVPPEHAPTPVSPIVNGYTNGTNGHHVNLAGAERTWQRVALAHGMADVPRPEPDPSPSGDAPFCDQCGNLMVRAGSCYTCTGCGVTSGCS